MSAGGPARRFAPPEMPQTPPLSHCPQAYVALAERLVEAARAVVLAYFRRSLAVEAKPDRSPVTRADREAEARMRALIAEACPDHGVVGEEHGRDRPAAEYVWVLDPIDGTKRFVSGHAQFGTLVGLLYRGRPVLGIIDMPVLEERWVGIAGQATRHRDRQGERIARVRACPGPARATLCATSPHMFPGADLAAFERVRARAALPLYGTECYAYGLLASGFVDLVIEATMGPYDFLPLVPVVEGAGGTITDWAGAPLGLASDGRVIAAGDARCQRAALALLQAG